MNHFQDFEAYDLSPIEELINEQRRFTADEKAFLRLRIRECSSLKYTPDDMYFYYARGLTFDQLKQVRPYISIYDWCEIERVRSAKGETFGIDYGLLDVIEDFKVLNKKKYDFFQKGIFDYLLDKE